jgi:hypothetical protein
MPYLPEIPENATLLDVFRAYPERRAVKNGPALCRQADAHADGITSDDAEAVYAAGWDQDALYHAVATCALINFMNRLVEDLGIEPQEAYVPMAAERLSKRGYTEMLRMLGSEKG